MLMMSLRWFRKGAKIQMVKKYKKDVFLSINNIEFDNHTNAIIDDVCLALKFVSSKEKKSDEKASEELELDCMNKFNELKESLREFKLLVEKKVYESYSKHKEKEMENVISRTA